MSVLTHPFTNTLTQAQMDKEDAINDKYIKYDRREGYYIGNNNFTSPKHEQLY